MMSTKFKPTHSLSNGFLVELEYRFACRHNGEERGLFHHLDGSYSLYPMSSVTELLKVLQVAPYEEPEPLRVAPDVGTEYWRIDETQKSGVQRCQWQNSAVGHQVFAAGEAFATKEDALAARAARRKARGFS